MQLTALEVILGIVSILLSFALFYTQKKLSKVKTVEKQSSYEVKELLQDLSSGSALVEFRRVDPSSVFLRSPRSL